MSGETNRAAAYWLEGGSLKAGTPQAYFSFLEEKGHVVSLVGGGGKTTLMYELAAHCCARGLRTAVMTTTKIVCPEQVCRTMEECLETWAAGGFAVCGTPLDSGKLGAPEPVFLDRLLEAADTVLIEADGARRLPCKAPAAHEPVILPQTDAVIAVMGLDALGRPVEEVCLRAERVMALLDCGPQHVLTREDMVRILLSEQGSRKSVGRRAYYVTLNKCDDARRIAGGKRLLELLTERGQNRAVLTAHAVGQDE